PRQILRYLRLEHDTLDDKSLVVKSPLLPDLRDAGGAMRLGAIAPACDYAAGVLANRIVHPDWLATQTFELHLARPITSSITAHCHPLRAGRNSVLAEAVVIDETGDEVGRSFVTYARLPRRDDNPVPPPSTGRVALAHTDEEPRIPFDEYLQLHELNDEGGLELDHHERIYNSFGSIQGGAMAAILERSGALAAERVISGPARSVNLSFHYAAQAREGPFHVDTQVLRHDSSGVLVRVQLVDGGIDHRLAAVGTVLAVPAT
ncbi:MAG: hypothetical protein GY929_00445, partial [Actinomycetia bacterium]|nr:hypothetical protein [Actinomycetes bacterium]